MTELRSCGDRTMELVLLRHGSTSGNAEHRYVGRTDEPLSQAGAREARESGGREDVGCVYVSPLQRARQTAAICFPRARQMVVDGLREMDFGDFEGRTLTIGAGRFGPYILHQKKYTSLPKDTDPMAITLEEAVALIKAKREQDNKKHLKIFIEDDKLEVLNGRYGPYLVYDGKNYRLPKNLHAKADELRYDECMAIIKKTEK